jgi:hypothetical protein
MAITNAQQYQQLVNKPANGKRPGYRGIGGYQSGRSAPTSSSRSTSSRNTAGPGDTGGEGGNRPSDQSDTQSRAVDRSSDLQTINHLRNQNRYVAEDEDLLPGDTLTPEDIKLNKREQEFQNFLNRRNKVNLFGTGRLLETPAQKFSNYNASVNRPFFENVVRSGKIPGVNFATLEDEDDYEKAYQNYMSDRLAGNIDAYGNPFGDNYYDSSGALVVTDTRDDGAGQKILPIDDLDDTEEDTTVPRNLGGLAPRIGGSIFDFTGLAEGGRVAAQQGGIMSQQGGSIMPRLNDLGTDVSSAEQMLQEINQRLESAESTLGEGGGGGMGSLPSGFKQLPNGGMIGPTIPYNPNNFGRSINAYTPRQMPIGQPGLINLADIQPGTQPMSPLEEAMRNGSLPNNTYQGMEGFAPQPGGPIQSPLQSAIRQGAMDGGRMRQMEMMEDEDDPTGGIMDLESGRQMYFLGKLVKKAGRAIKKVVKSPIGKAALLYFGAGALGNLAGGSGLGGIFKGAMSPSKFLTRSKLGNIFTKGGAKNILFGGQKLMGNAAKNNFVDFSGILGSGGKSSLGKTLGLSFGLPFALDALGVGKDKDEDGEIDYGPGIDIDRLRYAPYRTLAPSIVGSNYQTGTEGRKDGGRMGYQEGGDAEPVAKKTMPLLDMDGQEMDLRKEGGFVPLGRMERADDVPARLSKNEFVFTADAVRNAGEGDIDKGAEVMYNMMKNLESGGEVSEESQGLEGAREMFKTSQRLEEVL